MKSIYSGQHGFSHLLILVAVIVLALIGMLGFTFFKQIGVRSTNTSGHPNQTKNADPDDENTRTFPASAFNKVEPLSCKGITRISDGGSIRVVVKNLPQNGTLPTISVISPTKDCKQFLGSDVVNNLQAGSWLICTNSSVSGNYKYVPSSMAVKKHIKKGKVATVIFDYSEVMFPADSYSSLETNCLSDNSVYIVGNN